jgi:hypothetical protein
MLAAAPSPASAQDEVAITAAPITRFQGREPGERIGELIWRGGLNLTSTDDRFGGLSGLAFIDDSGNLVMVTDRGHFVSGQLLHDEAGAPQALTAIAISAIQNSSGADLPRQFARDAEAVEIVVRDGLPAAVRVGFEHLTRVADFTLTDLRPGGPAREVTIPDWLTAARTNATIESLCIAPEASPVAGSTLIITEGVRAENGALRGYMIGVRDRGDLTYRPATDAVPTDCAFLPDGDLIVLERGLGFLSLTMRLIRIPAAEIRPGNELRGELLLQASGGGVSNMEGLGVHTRPDGETRLTVIADDNMSNWLDTILLEFALP